METVQQVKDESPLKNDYKKLVNLSLLQSTKSSSKDARAFRSHVSSPTKKTLNILPDADGKVADFMLLN